MAYQVNKSDGTYYIVQDNTVNTETTLKLLGKNFAGYGEYVAENFVQLLENFSNDAAPVNPIEGQLWYKKDVETYFYFDGIEWKHLKLSTVGPLEVLDTNNVIHLVTAHYDEGNIISIVSNENFNVSTSDPVYPYFPTIGLGISLTKYAKFHGTATTAEYADLAENYEGDAIYEPGTVLKLGGEKEVTQTTTLGCSDVFGVVSTNPAYLMNSGCQGVAVALTGRVPVKVIGKVSKGDRLIASNVPGVAQSAAGSNIEWTQQIGRALQDKDTEEVELIEVVIGAR